MGDCAPKPCLDDFFDGCKGWCWDVWGEYGAHADLNILIVNSKKMKTQKTKIENARSLHPSLPVTLSHVLALHFLISFFVTLELSPCKLAVSFAYLLSFVSLSPLPPLPPAPPRHGESFRSTLSFCRRTTFPVH